MKSKTKESIKLLIESYSFYGAILVFVPSLILIIYAYIHPDQTFHLSKMMDYFIFMQIGFAIGIIVANQDSFKNLDKFVKKQKTKK